MEPDWAARARAATRKFNIAMCDCGARDTIAMLLAACRKAVHAIHETTAFDDRRDEAESVLRDAIATAEGK